VIDPRLSAKLRPHQVSGVKFLYRATTGMIEENNFGWALSRFALSCFALR
jgi:DNA repair and recombination RAD54-like protein